MGCSVRTRWYLVAGFLLAGIILIPVGWWIWKSEVTQRRLADYIRQAEVAMNSGNPSDAIAWVTVARPLASDHPESTGRLNRIELRAAGRLRDFPRLIRMYDADRQAFQETPEAEEAALWTVRLLQALKRTEEAEQLGRIWRERGAMKPAWFAAEVDGLLAANRIDEARVLLESTSFPGKDDSARQLRRALLSLLKPAEAIEWLDSAYASDPANPDVRWIRARILENAGEIARARVEYVAALVASPSNLLLRHELATFYLRQFSVADAVATWEQAPGPARLDLLALAGAFWRKVVVGGVAAEDARPIVGSLAGLTESIAALGPGQYPSREAFQAMGQPSEAEEAWWLVLLGLLQEGREEEALQHLQASRFRTRGMAPNLARELTVVLRWRLREIAPQPGDLMLNDEVAASPFSRAMLAWARRKSTDGSAPPPELAVVLGSPQVWSLMLASSGWVAAACDLLPGDSRAGSHPEWHTYALMKSLLAIHGPERALQYADDSAHATSVIEASKGECLLLAGQRDRAVALLESCSQAGGEAGYRACWLLAQLALAEGRADDVEVWVTRDAGLAGSRMGRELAARAQVSAGDLEAADRLYEALGDDSTEGLAWRARRAFAARDWMEAEELTLKLLERLPDQVILMKNLEAIRNARREP